MKQKYPDTKQPVQHLHVSNKTKDYETQCVDKIQKKYYDNKKTKTKKDLDNVKGILMTESFLKSYFGKVDDLDSSDSDQLDIGEMIKYFNDDNTDSEDASIFLV
jgi:hypothetical protein